MRKGISLITHHSSLITLLGLLVRPVQAATAAELPEFETPGGRLLVLRRHVVAALALGALQHDVIARHNLTSLMKACDSKNQGAYSTMSEMVPAPTVRPPARMANLS